MLRVGLVGGTGSGKSTAAAMFRDLGVPVLDADVVAHELYVPGGEILDRIAADFGPDVLLAGGGLDRPALAARVFGRPEALAKLDAIVHPPLLETLESRLRGLEERGERVAVVEAALLLRWGPPRFIDLVVGVVADRETRRRRLRERGMDPTDIEARLDMQVEEDELLRGSDLLLGNDGNLDALRRGVADLYEELKRRAAARSGGRPGGE